MKAQAGFRQGEDEDGVHEEKYSEADPFNSHIFTAKDGNKIIAQDAGDWSRNYVMSRKLSPHVEVTYLFPKHLAHDEKHFVEFLSIADSVVVKLVRSFQSINGQ